MSAEPVRRYDVTVDDFVPLTQDKFDEIDRAATAFARYFYACERPQSGQSKREALKGIKRLMEEYNYNSLNDIEAFKTLDEPTGATLFAAARGAL